MPGYPSIAPVQPFPKFGRFILEGAMDGALSLTSFPCSISFSFVFATQKIRGCSPLVFKGCPSPLSATPTFPRTAGNHPAAFLKNCCTEKLFSRLRRAAVHSTVAYSSPPWTRPPTIDFRNCHKIFLAIFRAVWYNGSVAPLVKWI